MTPRRDDGPLLWVAHPSPDLYGSDRQLLETVRAVRQAGWRVLVVLPKDGPLAALLRECGADVHVAPYPVLRKSLLHPARLLGLVLDTAVALARQVRRLRAQRPDVLWVNTVTIPVWAVAGRLAGVPVVVHVHEAEEDGSRVVRTALAAPLLAARAVVTNSGSARAALRAVLPALDGRMTVVHNGMPGPDEPPVPPRRRAQDEPARLALVGRLSPRKGVDVALEAVALLRGRGHGVELDVAGTVFAGYEWYEQQLRERSARPDLDGAVRLLGYVHPTWPILAETDVVLVPSRVEPFGNTAVEALLAQRPLVASRTQGLVEVVLDGRTGLLVEPDDPEALAEAIDRLLADPDLAARLASAGRADALDRFSPERYARGIVEVLAAVSRAVTTGRTSPGTSGGARRAGTRRSRP